MKKHEFLNELRQYLNSCPAEEAKKSIEYYSEMIDESIEAGMSEEEAVAALGSAEGIAAQIKCEIPPPKMQKKKNTGTALTLALILGAPLWFPLLIAAAAMLFSFCIIIITLEAVLWILTGSFALAALASVTGAIMAFASGLFSAGLMAIGTALCFTAFCLAGIPTAVCTVRLMSRLINALFRGIKNIFKKKEKRYE